MRTIHKLFLAIAFLSFIIACETANGPNFNDTFTKEEKIETLTSWLANLYKQEKISIVILYAEKGETKFYQCLGTADMEGQKPLTLDSSFNLASVSKQFTATAIMLLKQDGKLDFDQPVKTYLAEFPYKNITVRHLLNHTSGITDYMTLAKKDIWDDTKIFTNEDMLSLFVKYKPDLEFKPGSKFTYSNTGYVLLSAIIERISDSTFETFLAQRIFKPLKMVNTRVFYKLSKDKTFESRVIGKNGKNLNDLIFLDGVTGDGAVYASANDLLKWDESIYENKLVKKEIQDEAFKPVTFENGQKSFYGFGWILSKDNDNVFHRGAWVGFHALIKRNFVNKSLIIILSNNSSDEYHRAIFDSLENIYQGEFDNES